ncbi:MAG: hypothetical protein II649_06680 [Kiritimatiellae bacterium]|nr:hypothetical protein [Kiritimatiellia bacterium]
MSNALNELASRLRRNAATAMHGDTAEDIRAAADALDAFASVGEVAYSPNPYNHIVLVNDGNLVSPRKIIDAYQRAFARVAGEGGAKWAMNHAPTCGTTGIR